MKTNRLLKLLRHLRAYYRRFSEPSVTKIANKYRDPFLVLISCILSLRTQDKTTDAASVRLFARATTPRQIRRIPARQLQKLIYPVGFYRTKARTIKLIARELIKRFGGKVPHAMEELLSLKGVGRKTANLVLTLGFHSLGICVDTHVHRISNRLGVVETKNPLETEMALRRVLPKRFWIEYNDLLVTFGHNVCKPISPLCSKCRLRHLCPRRNVGKHR